MDLEYDDEDFKEENSDNDLGDDEEEGEDESMNDRYKNQQDRNKRLYSHKNYHLNGVG